MRDKPIMPGQPAPHGLLRSGDGRRLNLTRLRYFATVAQELHFGRAARRLGISQPPLSLHIKALEAELGTALFVRDRKQVFLTSAGRMLLGHALGLIEHAERLEQVMHGISSGEQDELFIGCVPSAMYDVLPGILTTFRARYPRVHVVLKEGHTMDVVDAVTASQIDIGLVWRNVASPSLGIQPILYETFSALVPAGHPLSGEALLSLDKLAAEPLILPPRKISPYHYDHIISAFTKIGLSPRIEYEVPTILSQIGFVASGFGIAISPSFARRFTTDQIRLLPIAEDMPSVVLSLVWRPERATPVVDRFREVAADMFRIDVPSVSP